MRSGFDEAEKHILFHQFETHCPAYSNIPSLGSSGLSLFGLLNSCFHFYLKPTVLPARAKQALSMGCVGNNSGLCIQNAGNEAGSVSIVEPRYWPFLVTIKIAVVRTWETRQRWQGNICDAYLFPWMSSSYKGRKICILGRIVVPRTRMRAI